MKRRTFISLMSVMAAAGVLTLSGTGATATDYAKDGQPWQSYMTQITKVVVEEGVTVLGKNLFYGASALTDVCVENVGNQRLCVQAVQK